MAERTVVMDAQAVSRAVTRISFEILERNRGAEDLCLIGIQAGGAGLARRIASRIEETEGRRVDCGALDITLYRDDIAAPAGYAESTSIDFAIDGKRVVLIDDVIYTGRSVRAAIDAIMSRGRPQNIQLAILVDRGHRELPIRADFIGKNLPTSKEERVEVLADGGPEDCVAIVKGEARYTTDEHKEGTTV